MATIFAGGQRSSTTYSTPTHFECHITAGNSGNYAFFIALQNNVHKFYLQ